MNWTFRSDLPIYTQLVDRFVQGIASGAMAPGARLSSVRDLATEAGVNPNTMQRALQELERQGLVYSQRPAGRYVTEDTERISSVRKTVARTELRRFLAAMNELGYDKNEIINLFSEEETTHADPGM